MYDVPPQENAFVVVTGANSGTGLEAARRLAAAGAEVVMAVRSLERGRAAREEILAQDPDAHLHVRELDLADLASVRRFADGLLDEERVVDLLLNNAGVMRPRRRTLSADGFELQFATNFLGHFALTVRLVPLLLAGAGSRVVTMSSTAAVVGRLRFDDPQWERHYRPFGAYAQSKLADLVFARELAAAARGRRWDLASLAAHPGFTRTNLFRSGVSIGRGEPRRSFLESRWLPSQDVRRGVEPLLYAATSPEALNGAYYGPDGLFSLTGDPTLVSAPRSARRADAARLWSLAEELTGLALPPA